MNPDELFALIDYINACADDIIDDAIPYTTPPYSIAACLNLDLIESCSYAPYAHYLHTYIIQLAIESRLRELLNCPDSALYCLY